MSVIKVATVKNTIMPHAPEIEVSIAQAPSLSAMFNSLHSSMNQELFEKCICNEGSHHEKYGRFLLHKGSHHVQPPN